MLELGLLGVTRTLRTLLSRLEHITELTLHQLDLIFRQHLAELFQNLECIVALITYLLLVLLVQFLDLLQTCLDMLFA